MPEKKGGGETRHKDTTRRRLGLLALPLERILWGFPIIAHTGTLYLIELNDFLLQDSQGIAQRLSRAKQGQFKIDKSRSALYLPNLLNFPKNSEYEVIQTYTGQATGNWVRSVVPSPDATAVL